MGLLALIQKLLGIETKGGSKKAEILKRNKDFQKRNAIAEIHQKIRINASVVKASVKNTAADMVTNKNVGNNAHNSQSAAQNFTTHADPHHPHGHSNIPYHDRPENQPKSKKRGRRKRSKSVERSMSLK